jgi:hypothetical protein
MMTSQGAITVLGLPWTKHFLIGEQREDGSSCNSQMKAVLNTNINTVSIGLEEEELS